MQPDRRTFLSLLAAGAAASVLAPMSRATSARRPAFKAVAFDAFPVFDPRPIFALAEKLFPGRGAELSNVWRTRQFEYQWLRALSGHYADFLKTTEDALVFATNMLKLELTPDKRKSLMQAYLELKAWPDVPAALGTLKQQGLKLVFLSNMTMAMLETGIKTAGLPGVFDRVLSTDQIKTYKPDPRAYQLAMDTFGLEKREILFVAFAGWDAAGAKAFGYPTFWVNRMNLPREELGVVPDATGATLADLVRFVTGENDKTGQIS